MALLEAAMEFVATFGMEIAFVTALVWAGIIVHRLRSDEDPSLRYSSSSGAGSTSILISGAHVSLLFAVAIGLLTWPAPAQNPALAVLLFGGVAAHWYLGKQEVEMS